MTTMDWIKSIQPSEIPMMESSYEQSLYVAEALQVAYNDTFTRIGLSELCSVMENGIMSITEGDDAETKKGLLRTIQGWYENAIKLIKGLFAKLASKVKAKIGEVRSKFESKYSAAVSSLKGYSGGTLTFGKFYSVYPDKWYDEYNSKMKDAGSKFETICEDAKSGSEFSIDDAKAELKKTLGFESDNFAKELRKKFEGKEVTVTTENLGSYSDIIKKLAFGDREQLSDLKSQYKTVKDDIDKAMKSTKKAVEKSANIKSVIAYANVLLRTLTKLAGALAEVSSTTYGAAAKVAISIIMKANKKSVKESVELENGQTADAAEKSAEGEKVSDKDVDKDLLEATIDEAFAWL